MADHAVLIGVEQYPGLNDLAGPCNDVEAFRAWLEDPAGGGLQPENIVTKMTSDFPDATSVNDAHPALSDMEALFRPLVRKATNGEHTSGRLFIFVAGHGFADGQDMDSAALFTADAEGAFFPHLPVREYANFFCRTWAFDEVVLIMDACRSTSALQKINSAPLPMVNPHANAATVKRFVAYATGFNQIARERATNGGEVRGIFTMALLDALRHANPNQFGRVNGTAVERHIHNSIEFFSGGLSIQPPQIDAEAAKDVFFVARPEAGSAVEFNVNAIHVGQDLVIDFGGREEVQRVQVGLGPIAVSLAPGLYKARIEGTAVFENFEVPIDGIVTI